IKFAKILIDLARERNFKSLVAPTGRKGLQLAEEFKPDAIILDIGLPDIDGWTVMEKLKDNPDTRHIPVHFISASDKSMEALRMGAIGFLSKPVTMEGLEGAFNKIEAIISKSIKNLLVVEDDENQRKSIIELIGNSDVRTTTTESGKKAFEMLKTNNFDCMVLDLGLSDISGFELLQMIEAEKSINHIPIIIYTGKEISRHEEEKLKKHAESIIIKGVRSPDRLFDEVTLFLHRVEANLPEEKQKMLRMIHDKELLFQNKKILLVDDDMRNVFAISNALEDKGMKVVIGKNGKQGVDLVEQHGDFDLVIMDIMMPEMDGYEAIRRIRKTNKHDKLPVIALTAKAMKGDRNKCIEAGANDYLAKPVDPDKLLSLLRVWLYR
ncbi:MAG: response regulator, partial [bacterium]|nr:response regulator [bacterium]